MYVWLKPTTRGTAAGKIDPHYGSLLLTYCLFADSYLLNKTEASLFRHTVTVPGAHCMVHVWPLARVLAGLSAQPAATVLAGSSAGGEAHSAHCSWANNWFVAFPAIAFPATYRE
jgi:hypothetical protein